MDMELIKFYVRLTALTVLGIFTGATLAILLIKWLTFFTKLIGV